MSQIPEGATHKSAGMFYRRQGKTWSLWGGAQKWIETACDWNWLDLHAESLVPAWSGEGLPPVGTVCEYKHVHEWQKVEVFAIKPNYIGSHTALFTFESGCWCECAEPSFFRPIRPPEQIAADARLHEIRNACTAISGKLEQYNVNLDCSAAMRAVIEAMIDAGYHR